MATKDLEIEELSKRLMTMKTSPVKKASMGLEELNQIKRQLEEQIGEVEESQNERLDELNSLIDQKEQKIQNVKRKLDKKVKEFEEVKSTQAFKENQLLSTIEELEEQLRGTSLL